MTDRLIAAAGAGRMGRGLAIAFAYIDHALERGLDVNDVAAGITFNFDIHGNLWEQVAKFRAGRRLWARILKERYGATNPRALKLRMIAGGGGGETRRRRVMSAANARHTRQRAAVRAAAGHRGLSVQRQLMGGRADAARECHRSTR